MPAGRPHKTSGSYKEMTESGARWANNWGMEMPLYFSPSKDFIETGTLHRSESFEIVAKECDAVESFAGLMDISGYARYEVSGNGAREWLDNLLGNEIPVPGKVRLAPMLGEDGRLKGDLTCMNWGGGRFWLMGSYYLRAFHMRWFNDHLVGDVVVQDISDKFAGFTLSGPNSRNILSKLTDNDIEQYKMMSCFEINLGNAKLKLARMSLSGELAYEINCKPNEHSEIRRLLLGAGSGLGIKEIGTNAVLSMRLEKSIGIWSREFTQSYSPEMTGLDRWISWDKGGFIGRDAALSQNQSKRVLCMLEIFADNSDAHGFEPVLFDNLIVGITTSGGYGHRLKRSFAMAMIDRAYSEISSELVVFIAGIEQKAVVIPMSPYNPEGDNMRI
jgi:dimethylglycine dehydrogenase